MLLNDLMKHTEKDHPDFPKLQSALEIFREVGDYLNKMKSQQDVRNRLLEISSKIQGYPDVNNFPNFPSIWI